MSERICVFCGKSPPHVKISKEHVMRSALKKYLPEMVKSFVWDQTFRGNISEDLQARRRKIPLSPFDWMVNDVCKVCNEGWLNNSVEAPVEGHLAALMNGVSLSISAQDAKLIALWAAKTAAVRALMDPLPRAIPSEHYHFMREKLEPPENTMVWLAHSEYCSKAFMRHTRLGTLINESEMDTTSHLTTIVYGHMALYVIGASDYRGLEIYESTIAEIEAYDTLRVWPARSVSTWPYHQIPLDLIRQLSSFKSPPGQDLPAGFLAEPEDW